MSMEDYLHQTLAAAVKTVSHKERDWDADKLQKKIHEYINAASKRTAGGKDWEALIADYTSKFYEAYFRALGDRSWLDDLDLVPSVAAAIRAYCDSSVVMQCPSESDFNEHVSKGCALAYDTCRYYSWGWQVVKTVITLKSNQKKAREAIDTAREEVVNQLGLSCTSEEFVRAWIASTIRLIAAASNSGNPKNTVSQADATRLFDEMCQEGGGLPLPLTQAGGKPPRNWSEITEAVAAAYSSFPDVGPAGGKGGGGYGKAGGGGGGYGRAPSIPNFNADPMEAYNLHMQAMIALQQQAGWGSAPY